VLHGTYLTSYRERSAEGQVGQGQAGRGTRDTGGAQSSALGLTLNRSPCLFTAWRVFSSGSLTHSLIVILLAAIAYLPNVLWRSGGQQEVPLQATARSGKEGMLFRVASLRSE
jgi:hypothetical protein